jgi:spermidine/putrescine transport system substrate-binding protein
MTESNPLELGEADSSRLAGGAVTRRRFIGAGGATVLGATALGSFLASCGGDDDSGASAGTIGGTMNVLGFPPYVDKEGDAAFRRKHSLEVSVSAISNNDEILSKLKGGGLGKIDAITPNIVYIKELVKADVVQPIDTKKIPNLELVLPAIRKTSDRVATVDGKIYGVPYFWGYDAMIYNATKLPKPPASWMDILKPEYKGKVLLNVGPNVNFEIWPRVLGFDQKRMTKQQLDKVVDFIIQLKKTQVRAVTEDGDDQLELLRGGEVWVIGSGAFAGLPQRAKGKGGDKIAATVPKEGTASWIDGWAIAKDAPNPDAAHAYINYVLGTQFQAMMAPKLTEATVNSKAVELLPADQRKVFPYDDPNVGSGKLPLFELPDEGPELVTYQDWNEAWERIASA